MSEQAGEQQQSSRARSENYKCKASLSHFYVILPFLLLVLLLVSSLLLSIPSALFAVSLLCNYGLWCFYCSTSLLCVLVVIYLHCLLVSSLCVSLCVFHLCISLLLCLCSLFPLLHCPTGRLWGLQSVHAPLCASPPLGVLLKMRHTQTLPISSVWALSQCGFFCPFLCLYSANFKPCPAVFAGFGMDYIDYSTIQIDFTQRLVKPSSLMELDFTTIRVSSFFFSSLLSTSLVFNSTAPYNFTSIVTTIFSSPESAFE